MDIVKLNEVGCVFQSVLEVERKEVYPCRERQSTLLEETEEGADMPETSVFSTLLDNSGEVLLFINGFIKYKINYIVLVAHAFLSGQSVHLIFGFFAENFL